MSPNSIEEDCVLSLSAGRRGGSSFVPEPHCLSISRWRSANSRFQPRLICCHLLPRTSVFRSANSPMLQVQQVQGCERESKGERISNTTRASNLELSVWYRDAYGIRYFKMLGNAAMLFRTTLQRYAVKKPWWRLRPSLVPWESACANHPTSRQRPGLHLRRSS